MLFDLSALTIDQGYKLLTSTVTPRPIGWVTTMSADGVINAAPYSFFNAMGSDPPIVALGMMKNGEGQFKDTPANILATGEFVVNLVPEALGPQMSITCMDAPPEVDELACAGLAQAPSVKVRPPRIAAAPVAIECRSLHNIETGPRQLLAVGQVLAIHIADHAVIDPQRCHVDTPALGLIARMHGSGWYARSTDLFQMDRVTYAGWLAAQGDGSKD